MTDAVSRSPALDGQLPPFYCPLPSALHPEVEHLEQRAIAWLGTSGVFGDEVDRAWNVATNSAEFACRVCPDGNADRVLLFAEWTYLLFAIDDADWDCGPVASVAQIVDSSLYLIRGFERQPGAVLGDEPYTQAFADLVRRTREAASLEQFHRIAFGLRDLLLGAAWQAVRSERGSMPTLADYIPARIADVGTLIDVALIEFVNDNEVPAGMFHSDPVRAITEITGFIVASDNDLFSYAKEAELGVSQQNLVTVIAQERGCSERDALPQAVALRDRAMTLFLRLREHLDRDTCPELRRYLQGLGYYISGNIAWSNTVPRYASPRNHHALPDPTATLGITLSDTPSNPDPDPLTAPSIAWWWDQVPDPDPSTRTRQENDHGQA